MLPGGGSEREWKRTEGTESAVRVNASEKAMSFAGDGSAREGNESAWRVKRARKKVSPSERGRNKIASEANVRNN